jgi:hypothetical protein
MNTTEKPAEDKSKRQGRSPAYPLVSLGDAIARVRKLWEAQRKHPGQIDSVLKALGYNSQSGTALRTLAALGHYGLIVDSGIGDERRISVSERAQDILLLPESDSRQADALKKAALEPAIFKELWDRYGKTLPINDSISPYLVRDKGFNESIVSEVINNYRESFQLAKLGDLGEDNSVEDSGKPQNDAASQINTKPLSSHQLKKADSVMTQTNLEHELPVLVADGRIARIPFPMSNDDFDLLIGTLNLWKKKLTKVIEKPVQQDNYPAPPFVAQWKNKDFDKMVKIVGLMGEKNGEKYYQTDDGTGIKASELFPDANK